MAATATATTASNSCGAKQKNFVTVEKGGSIMMRFPAVAPATTTTKGYGKFPAPALEATSAVSANFVLDNHTNALVGAAVTAFAEHYPLELKADFLWFTILQGIARHVEVHAEQLRGKFVNHLGKKELIVRRDNFVLGNPHNDWEGVFPEFVTKIEENTKPDVVSKLEARFSTTTPIDIVAGKVAIMDVCQSFFEYTVHTMCGFPSITLQGPKADWVLLQQKVAGALELCEAGFAKSWGGALNSILAKFIEAYDGVIDEDFWQSMVKRGGTVGSGARSWYTGWINALFPYYRGQGGLNLNEYCIPYNASNGYVKDGLFNEPKYSMFGPQPADASYMGLDVNYFPPSYSEVPVKWLYLSQEYPLKFRAGVVAFAQDPKTFTITPQVGWSILRGEMVPQQ